jgi:hypothetical protein
MKSRKVVLLAVLPLLVLSIVAGSGIFGSGTSVIAQSGNTPTLPSGPPSFSNLTPAFNAYAIMIEQSAQFKALANGTTYHLDPSGSFGYSTVNGTLISVTVTFFAPNGMAYINADVFVANSTIQDMNFVNGTYYFG